MGDDKTKAKYSVNALSATGLNTKAITGVNFHLNGSVKVMEFSFSGGSQFIKVLHNNIEVGGNQDWGTGTVVL